MKQAERPGLHRWSRHEYGRLIDHGFLDEDDPIELLDGLLLVKEPQHSPHRTAVLLVAKALERGFGEGWFVQTQSPIILDDRSEPEPDVCVVRGSPRDYAAAHPTRHPRTGRAPARRRSRAWPSRADGRPRHMPARESRTTGFSTSTTACWRSIVSRRARARHAGTGATRRSKRWAPTPRSRRSPRLRRPSESPISCRSARSTGAPHAVSRPIDSMCYM